MSVLVENFVSLRKQVLSEQAFWNMSKRLTMSCGGALHFTVHPDETTCPLVLAAFRATQHIKGQIQHVSHCSTMNTYVFQNFADLPKFTSLRSFACPGGRTKYQLKILLLYGSMCWQS
jgi:hypothetical protein